MNPVDPMTLVGGGSIFVCMVTVFGLLVRRLTAQDTGWKALVDQQAKDLAALREDISNARVEIGRLVNELAATRSELAAARLQIAELQKWEGRRDS